MQPHNLNTRKITICIKNMVSNSCVRIVREELERTGFIKVLHIELGIADIQYDAQVFSQENINQILIRNGFSLIADKGEKMVEKIKTSIIQLIYYGNNTNSLVRNSDYLSQKLNMPYLQLSKLFSDHTGTTLEKYIIMVKMERIKELITYDEMTLSEIAYLMGYSSVQYLSNQFKQITGVSVTEYKDQLHKSRKPLSSLLEPPSI